VKRGEFRADLYYRLNVVTLRLVPLRERKQDIPQLAQLFARKHARRLRCPEPAISDEVLGALAGYDWPGNIRELEHWAQRAVVLGRCGPLRPEDLLPRAVEEPSEEEAAVCFGGCTHSLEQIEQMYIEQVLELTEGNQSRAAQLLQIDRKTLRAKLQRYAEQASGTALRSVS
jgi:DNA-binding NtrC family response regulator